jgi:hypothetical protein
LAWGLLKNRLLLDHNMEAAGGRCGGHGTAMLDPGEGLGSE